jgi:hypothetical protein
MRDSLVLACRVDKWTAPARNCFADATTQSSFYGCDVHLTVEQRTNLSQAAR